MMRECEICGRQADLFKRPSMLDGYFYGSCSECLDHCGESWKAIANFLREAKWSDLSSEIESVITVWQDDGYVPVKVGVRRMLERQPVPAEEREADAVLRQMRRVIDTVSAPSPIPRRRKHWFAVVLVFFGSWRELPA